MQTLLVVLIVAAAALFWMNRFFPAIGKTLWQGMAITLKLVKAPLITQQWALKRSTSPAGGGCASSCGKCSSKCH